MRAGASDIHVEPQRDGVCGSATASTALLREVMTRAPQRAGAVVSRIKIVVRPRHRRAPPAPGRPHPDPRRRPRVDARVSTLPSLHGEKVVVRLLARADHVPPLDELGLDAEQLASLRERLAAPQGLVLHHRPDRLAARPTRCTPRCSEIHDADRNIVTLEDPVEMQLPGITQVQVNERTGLTFARGLRAVLRQDPDVVLVGEVRDTETAELAMRASLTGHLVLTTLHTNDAVAALTRLVDMGVEPFLVASSLTRRGRPAPGPPPLRQLRGAARAGRRDAAALLGIDARRLHDADPACAAPAARSAAAPATAAGPASSRCWSSTSSCATCCSATPASGPSARRRPACRPCRTPRWPRLWTGSPRSTRSCGSAPACERRLLVGALIALRGYDRVVDHPRQQVGQGARLGVVEAADRVLGHAAQVDRAGRAQPLEPGVGEHREQAARVAVARLPAYQTLPLEAVDQPGEPAAGEQHPLGELAHPQPAVRCLHQLDEHVVGRQRQSLLSQQIALQRSGDERVGAQEAPPGEHLRLGQVPRPRHAAMVRRGRPARPNRLTPRSIAVMSATTAAPSQEAVQAALATVDDPEIRRPITDLGMVKSVDISATGEVTVAVYLTVAGCPMRDTITRTVTEPQ